MEEKKMPVRKKGRTETVIADLAEYGLILSGVSVAGEKEELVPIDPVNPYKDQTVFEKSNLYRVFNRDGIPVFEHRRISGIRRWIDSGEIVNHQAIADRQKFMEEYGEILNLS